jgi:hypothetical protein
MKEVFMRRLVVIAAVTAAAALAAGSAGAASPSQEQCEAQGGMFDRQQGQVQCVIVEEGKNDKFTEETTTTGQGNTGNKTERSSECGGTGSGKCPPGQFP